MTASVKKPCDIKQLKACLVSKHKPKATKPKILKTEINVGLTGGQTVHKNKSLAFGMVDAKFRMLFKTPAKRVSAGFQLQGFHGLWGSTDLSGVSGGPALDARVSASVPLHVTLAPVVGAILIGKDKNREALPYLGAFLGLKYFFTKMFFVEAHLEAGGNVSKGSGVDVYLDGSHVNESTSSTNGLLVRGGLSVGLAL